MTPFLRSFLCVAALGLSARALPAEAQKSGDVLIGYVNLQRAILETEEGKRVFKSLKSTIDEKQKKLSAKETELKALMDKMDKEPAGKEDPQARKTLNEKLMDLRQSFMKEQQELQEAERKQLGDLTTKMRKTIETIGQAGGYTLILEGQETRLLFAKTHLDLTNEVIRAYNNKNK